MQSGEMNAAPGMQQQCSAQQLAAECSNQPNSTMRQSTSSAAAGGVDDLAKLAAAQGHLVSTSTAQGLPKLTALQPRQQSTATVFKEPLPKTLTSHGKPVAASRRAQSTHGSQSVASSATIRYAMLSWFQTRVCKDQAANLLSHLWHLTYRTMDACMPDYS